MNQLVKAVKALSDATRIRMVNLLLERECCVCEIMQVMDISQTRASRNLSILYEAGFLNLRKEGLWAYYSIEKTQLEAELLRLVQAIEAGIKNNRVALQDKKRLKGARRLGPETCTKC